MENIYEAQDQASTSAMANATSIATSEGGKVKQKRRRQRLSCVECTKRRQKCDRQFPCGLCTTRGISHLCRWEPIVVRPTPQRPPAAATNAAATATIEALSSRIATLERALLQQQQQQGTPPVDAGQAVNTSPSPDSVLGSGAESPSSIAEDAESHTSPEEDGPRALIDYNVQLAAVALAQLSLAPKTEYVGNGTVLCAIHKLGDPGAYRFPHPAAPLTSLVPSSVAEIVNHRNRTWELLSEGMGGIEDCFPSSGRYISPIQRLVSKLPSRAHVEELITSFFAARNWQFGISERWFRSACQTMWDHIDQRCDPTCTPESGCKACMEEVNPHWLSLLFSVLALAPGQHNSSKNCANYFMHALTAKRFVDDILLASPVYSTSEGAVNGGVLSCIAAVFLAMYLVDRGRVSEAWKIIGGAVRSAQALGMHRDPAWQKWDNMPPVDRELRVTGWWLLLMADRLWSFILGRPPMAPKGTYDVMTMPSERHADGTPNPSAPYLRAFASLADIIGEACEKCLGVHTPPYATVLEMDRKFQDWEAKLPSYLRWRKQPSSTTSSPQPSFFSDAQGGRKDIPPEIALSLNERDLGYQRHTLAAWYLGALMNVHRPYLMHCPPILPPPGTAPGPRTRLMLNPSRERCIELALELTRILCDFNEEYKLTAAWPDSVPFNAGTFGYFVFDGAVALAGALSQVPPHPQSADCLQLMDRAMGMLDEFAQQAQGNGALDGEGEMPRRAIVVLKALRKAGGWDRRDEEKGELVLLQDMLRQTRQGQKRSSGQTSNGTSASTTNPDFFPMSTPMANPSYGMGAANPLMMSNMTSSATSTPMSFIPFLNSPYSPTLPSAFSGTGSASQGLANGYGSTLPSVLNPFSGGSWFGGGDTSSAAGITNRPVQSMLMPIDILRDVPLPSDSTMDAEAMSDMVEMSLDWARVAGMESWYSGATTDGGAA